MTARQLSFQEAVTVIKHNLDILEVIGRHVALRKAGRSYTGLCPFHREKSPSFYVTPEKQMFKCFGCGEGGDTLSFLMKIDNKTFGELIQDLADDQGIEIKREGRQQNSKDEIDVLIHLNTLARAFYEEQLQAAPAVQGYLEGRQMTPQWQTYFGLGYAPQGWENLVRRLQQQVAAVQATPMLLEKAGLANLRSEGNSYYDRFRNRLMIPIQDDRGRVVAFGGRSLSDEDIPKYLNSPETPIYAKSRILYGLAQGKEAIRETRSAILMEGYFDVISAHMAGLPQAVGVCGTALTESHLKLLQRYGAETLYLCFDSDNAGQTAALRAIELVENQLLEQQLTLKIVVLPGEKDPDDFLKHHGREAFLACLEAADDFLTFKFGKALEGIPNLATPEGRIQAVQRITPMLLGIRQPVIRQEFLKQMAEQIRIAEETLVLELKRVEQQNKPYGYKKNYQNQAISNLPERYKGEGRWKNFKKPAIVEDIPAFRRRLSEKLPIEEKEHILLSYLFVSEESHRLVMTQLPHLQLHSAFSLTLLEAVSAAEGQWNTLKELIHQLHDAFYAQENADMVQFLAHRVLEAEELQTGADLARKGLKSQSDREKLSRDILDIIQTIQQHRERASLTSLVQHGKQHEQEADDQLALQVQLELREALRARRQGGKAQPPTPLGPVDSHVSVIEEQQGV